MGERGRFACVIGVVMLLAAAAMAPEAQAQTTSVPPASPPVVSPFFIVPTARPATSPILRGFSLESVTRQEHWTVACAGCGKVRFRATRALHRVKLRAVPPVRMRSATRLIAGVTGDNEVGRWIVFGFQNGHYRGFDRGCMAVSVKTLTPADAVDPDGTIRIPCGASSPPKTEYVYWTSTDHQVYEKQYPVNTPSRWSDSLAIGSGTGVRSAPSAVICGNGERDVFWKGSDRRIHWMTFNENWTDESALPSGPVGSGPSAAVDADGAEHLFWEGTDGYLYEMSGFGGVWSTRTLNSGLLGSQPAVVARPGGALELFWLGRNRFLYEMRIGATAKPVPNAAKIGSAPAAALEPNGLVEDVFWRGTDGVLWELSRPNSGSPTISRLISGPLGSAPAIAFHPDDAQDVFWRGTDRSLQEMVWADNTWIRPIVPNRVPVGSRPAAVVSPANQTSGKSADCG